MTKYFVEMLQPIAKQVWVETRELRFWGIETGTKMTIVRLAGGGLFVHSPVALDERTRQAVDALGPVAVIVAPNLYHHLYVDAWAQAYPDALVCGCPGLSDKRPDLSFHHVLGDEPDATWQAEIDQVFFSARSFENEVAFFHAPSRTLICADLLFNLSTHPSRLTRMVARVIGNRGPSATLVERVMVRDRTAAREQVDRMLAWRPERMVLAHGDMVESNATDVLRRAYDWL